MIAALTPNAKIVRWGEWYAHPDFPDTLAAFQAAFENNPFLREAVIGDVAGFYDRQEKVPTLRQQSASVNFLIEEMAVLTLQARALPGVRIYPGNELQCLALVRSKAVDVPRGIEREQFMRVKFLRKTPTNKHQLAV